MVTWVIEHGIFDNEVQLIEEVRKQGHNVIEIDYKHDYYVDDIARNQRYTKLLSQPVIFRGSLNVSSEVEYTLWIPGTYCNRDNFNCSTYYAYWGKYMLNTNYTMMSGSELIRRWYADRLFVRPDIGFKEFNGGTYTRDEFIKLNLHPELLVISSPVKKVDLEWRFVVTGNTIVAGSQYLPIETNVTSNAAIEYLQSILNELTWCPDDIYTVDVCFANGSYHVLELNSLSCSNLYQCDLAAVVETVSKLAINKYDYCNE
jgi:hypothetical protein